MRALLRRSRRSILVMATVAVAAVRVSSCSPWSIGAAYLARKIEARPAEYDVRIERHVTIRASDGTKLAADIFHPLGPAEAPTILVRLPYSKTLYNQMVESVVGTLWAERGYTAVFQGTRGRFDSAGVYYPLKYERQDGIDKIGRAHV